MAVIHNSLFIVLRLCYGSTPPRRRNETFDKTNWKWSLDVYIHVDIYIRSLVSIYDDGMNFLRTRLP